MKSRRKSDEDVATLVPEDDDDADVGRVKVFKRRWYILLVFSLLAMFQCTVWNTWGPVAEVSVANILS